MIGVLGGLKCGVRPGIAAGVGTDPLGATWSIDPLSKKGVPANAGEMTSALRAAGITSGGATSVWMFQDASGNPVDSIGSNTLTATTLGYQAAVSGWTRKAITMAEASGANALFAAGAVNPASTSVLWLAYMAMPTAPAVVRRALVGSAGATNLCVVLLTSGILRCQSAGTNTDGASNFTTGGGVRPLVLAYNRTAASLTVYSDQEKIVGTYNSGVVDGNKGFGGVGSTAPAMSLVYGAAFSGAAAELTSAQVKSLLQTLGWSIPWS